MESKQTKQGTLFFADKVTKYWKNQTPHTGEEHFIDPLFPHTINSLIGIDSHGNFSDPEFAKTAKEINTQNLEWRCAREIFTNFLIFDDKIEHGDLNQKYLGDCYYVSTVAALTEFPSLIYKLFRTKEVTENGYYEVVLFIDGEWQIVILDDYFPVNKSTDKLEFLAPNGNELWTLFLEKAWAKINGSYNQIIGGWPCDPLHVLTGFPTTKIFHPKLSEENLWETIQKYDHSNYIMVTTTINEQSISSLGLVACHAYTLIGGKEVIYNGETLRLVQIRNPWGYGEWTGDWSDNSSLWTDELKTQFGLKDENDGCFFMTIKDFKTYYYRTDVCLVEYGANVKNFKITKEGINKPHVYNLLVENESQFHLSLHREHQRYNHKNLKQSLCPMSLVFAKYDQKKNILIDVDGESGAQDNLFFNKKLSPGLYVIWVYYAYDKSEEPRTENLNLNFYSVSNYKVKLVVQDENFNLIREMIVQGLRQDFAHELVNSQFFQKADNSYKTTKIGYTCVINPSSEFYYKMKIDSSGIQNMFVLPPHDGKENIILWIPPQGYNIYLGMQMSSWGWFNINSNFSTLSCNEGEDPTNSKSTFQLENFVSFNNVLFEKNEYDYTCLSTDEAMLKLKFSHIDINSGEIKSQEEEKKQEENSFSVIEMLEKEHSEIISQLKEIKPLDEDDTLIWKKINEGDNYYIGQVNEFGVKHGRGAFIWLNLDMTYIGYYSNGNREPSGKMLGAEGKLNYVGDYYGNNMHGQGTYYFANGDVYRGAWENNKSHGQGWYQWANGSTWEGNFICGEMKGIGMYTPNGCEPYEYEF